MNTLGFNRFDPLLSNICPVTKPLPKTSPPPKAMGVFPLTPIGSLATSAAKAKAPNASKTLEKKMFFHGASFVCLESQMLVALLFSWFFKWFSYVFLSFSCFFDFNGVVLFWGGNLLQQRPLSICMISIKPSMNLQKAYLGKSQMGA